MSQVRRHDNVQLGPEDLLLSIVGGPGEEAVRIFKIGHRIWVAALAGAPHAMAADRGRGAEAGTGRAVTLTCHCRKLNPASK